MFGKGSFCGDPPLANLCSLWEAPMGGRSHFPNSIRDSCWSPLHDSHDRKISTFLEASTRGRKFHCTLAALRTRIALPSRPRAREKRTRPGAAICGSPSNSTWSMPALPAFSFLPRTLIKLRVYGLGEVTWTPKVCRITASLWIWGH